MNNISVALTEPQVLLRQKDVTRRIGWEKLTAGTLLQPVRKGQGLKKGEKATKVGGPIRVLGVSRETLRRLLDDQAYGLSEVVREGFPGLTPQQFVTFFMASHDCLADAVVTRIEFSYIDPVKRTVGDVITDIVGCADPADGGKRDARRYARELLALSTAGATEVLASMDEWLGNSEGLTIEDVIEWREQLAAALGKGPRV